MAFSGRLLFRAIIRLATYNSANKETALLLKRNFKQYNQDANEPNERII